MIEDFFLPPCYMCQYVQNKKSITMNNALCKLHRCYWFLLLLARGYDKSGEGVPWYTPGILGQQLVSIDEMETWIVNTWNDWDKVLDPLRVK